MSGDFYTYELVNSLTNNIFYVGKGKNARINFHEYQARRLVQAPLYEYIRQIWEQGGRVIRRKVQRDLTEKESHGIERQLIAKYGRENLFNRTEGGEGGSSRVGRYASITLEIRRDLLEGVEWKIRLGRYRSRREVIEEALMCFLSDSQDE